MLASASPRRKQLLGEIVEQFDIIPANGEEVVDERLSPKETVLQLSKQKANAVASLFACRDKIVLGSDTVVALDGQILGKPKDEADAFRMLSALSGRTHEVYTGVCLLCIRKDGTQICLQDSDCTKVVFNRLSKEEIERYIATGSPMDKAGAYGIQDGNLVQSIEGSFSNVVGLPVELCRRMKEEMQEKCAYQVCDEV